MSNDLFEYINKTYCLNVTKGDRVKFGDKLGTIVGVKNAYLKIQLDGEKNIGNYHPTWNLEHNVVEL